MIAFGSNLGVKTLKNSIPTSARSRAKACDIILIVRVLQTVNLQSILTCDDMLVVVIIPAMASGGGLLDGDWSNLMYKLD